MEAISWIFGITFVVLLVCIMIYQENRRRRTQCRPTMFEEMRQDIRKDAKPILRSLDDIKDEHQATTYTLEIITFVVRFVCGDAALPRLDSPHFRSMRVDLAEIIQPCLKDANFCHPALIATQPELTQACRIILDDEQTLTALIKYCLEHFDAFRKLRNAAIDPRLHKRRDIRTHHYRQAIPSIEAMTWLRLMREACLHAD